MKMNVTYVLLILVILDFSVLQGNFMFAVFDSSTNPQWRSGNTMPTARSESTSALLDNKIYVIGGLDGTDKPVDSVEAYNTKFDKWESVAPLPFPLDHAGADAYNGKIYVVGGKSINSFVSNKLLIYDPGTDKWKEGRSMPTARYALTADFVNGILYTIGGKNKELMGYMHETLDKNEAYNPHTDTWASRASILAPTHHGASAVVDGKLYIIGGRNTNFGDRNYLNGNYRYDPESDSWKTLESMPTNRSASDTAVVDKKIHVFGGEICDEGGSYNTVFDEHEVYDTTTDSWSLAEKMPTARHGPSVQFTNGSIYVIGGGIEPCMSKSNINEIFLLQPNMSSVHNK